VPPTAGLYDHQGGSTVVGGTTYTTPCVVLVATLMALNDTPRNTIEFTVRYSTALLLGGRPAFEERKNTTQQGTTSTYDMEQPVHIQPDACIEIMTSTIASSTSLP
jgi:hypothetical protein